MAIFGRGTARRRLRSAARQSLAVPAFSAPVDCSAWVLGDVWPAELTTRTAETATLADYLSADLQRIVNFANHKLQEISRARLVGADRRAAETRVINVARAFAVLRVQSTVRQLRSEALGGPAENFSLNPAAPTADPPPPPAPPPAPGVKAAVASPVHGRSRPDSVPSDPVAPLEETPADDPAGPPAADEARGVPESAELRLRRSLEFVARQEPGLRWAVGTHQDGRTVLVTDIASGWIPSGIQLPAGVRLLAPGWRAGNVTALLDETTLSAAYAPGDRLGWAGEFGPTEPSREPRGLPMVGDFGWLLAEATHWRDGLPRMVNTLAKAGAAGTGVADAEVDLLRVHLDTARYQLLAQYPDVDRALLLNCILLAATEGIATGDEVTANYHFAWFQALSSPPTMN